MAAAHAERTIFAEDVVKAISSLHAFLAALRRKHGSYVRNACDAPMTACDLITAAVVEPNPRSLMNPIRWTAAIAFAAIVSLPLSSAAIAGTPNFPGVAWQPLGCPNADLITHDSPASADFTGSATAGNEPAYYAFDSSYLYFRYRMSGNPADVKGFDQYSWTALMQVPSGNRFQYQYQLSLNGKTDTIEIWQNTDASDISFDPIFHDDSEVKQIGRAHV